MDKRVEDFYFFVCTTLCWHAFFCMGKPSLSAYRSAIKCFHGNMASNLLDAIGLCVDHALEANCKRYKKTVI